MALELESELESENLNGELEKLKLIEEYLSLETLNSETIYKQYHLFFEQIHKTSWFPKDFEIVELRLYDFYFFKFLFLPNANLSEEDKEKIALCFENGEDVHFLNSNGFLVLIEESETENEKKLDFEIEIEKYIKNPKTLIKKYITNIKKYITITNKDYLNICFYVEENEKQSMPLELENELESENLSGELEKLKLIKKYLKLDSWDEYNKQLFIKQIYKTSWFPKNFEIVDLDFYEETFVQFLFLPNANLSEEDKEKIALCFENGEDVHFLNSNGFLVLIEESETENGKKLYNNIEIECVKNQKKIHLKICFYVEWNDKLKLIEEYLKLNINVDDEFAKRKKLFIKQIYKTSWFPKKFEIVDLDYDIVYLVDRDFASENFFKFLFLPNANLSEEDKEKIALCFENGEDVHFLNSNGSLILIKESETKNGKKSDFGIEIKYIKNLKNRIWFNQKFNQKIFFYVEIDEEQLKIEQNEDQSKVVLNDEIEKIKLIKKYLKLDSWYEFEKRQDLFIEQIYKTSWFPKNFEIVNLYFNDQCFYDNETFFKFLFLPNANLSERDKQKIALCFENGEDVHFLNSNGSLVLIEESETENEKKLDFEIEIECVKNQKKFYLRIWFLVEWHETESKIARNKKKGFFDKTIDFLKFFLYFFVPFILTPLFIALLIMFFNINPGIAFLYILFFSILLVILLM